VSQSSPGTGAATNADARRDDRPPASQGDSVSIDLEASRQRQISWAVGGTLIGALLVLKMGTVAVWGGYVLIAIGLFRAYELVRSFRNPAGTILVSDREVVLPRGLHDAKPLKVATSEITAVYFLRRSVPWNRSSPVLVVELGERALAFPRDWFASEADQRHVVHALLAHLRPVETAATPT
jgi:hypothetical protein